jgi:hypothetical protein
MLKLIPFPGLISNFFYLEKTILLRIQEKNFGRFFLTKMQFSETNEKLPKTCEL